MRKKQNKNPTFEEVAGRVAEHVRTNGLPEGPPKLWQFKQPSRSSQVAEAVGIGVAKVFLFLFRVVCWFVGLLLLNYVFSLDMNNTQTVACAVFVSACVVIGEAYYRRRGYYSL